MFDKNSLESFVFSPQLLLRDFCIYLLLNNITFESHQRRKEKNKSKTIFISMDYNKKFMFSAAVRGFHFYRRAWVPTESEKLKCAHDKNNPFDDCAIKTMNNSGQTVGHLPMELSRITKFLIDRGAKVEAQLSSTNYRRSPLIQGDLEIPCDVIVTMPGTIDNQLILEKYKKLVCEKYAEPKEEVIIGSFLE